jgi:hypothetical protein
MIEAIGLFLKIANENVKIVSAYFLGSTRAPVPPQYRGDIRRLAADRSSYIVCEDLNSCHRLWGCIRANRAGKILFEENSAGGLVINHPHASTYYLDLENSAATPLTLDIMLTNGLCNISNLILYITRSLQTIVLSPLKSTVMALLSLLVGNLFPVIVGQIRSDLRT